MATKDNVVLSLNYTAASLEAGVNVFANSYTAPIDITKFEDSDFSTGVDKTIYLFNTGSKNDSAAHAGEINGDAAGQYIAIPILLAGEVSGAFQLPAVIPSMQGFYMKTNQSGTLTLNYERLVWNASHANTLLRAQAVEDETPATLCVSLSSDGWSDKLYLLESEEYNPAFENGYDAHKMMRGNFNIFAVENADFLTVDATNSISGTRVGVRTGEDIAYTLSFSHLRGTQEWALVDDEAEVTVDILEGTQYTFIAEPLREITNRFRIVERSSVPAVTTDIDEKQSAVNAHKFIKDGQLFILKNGVLYNTIGAVVH